MKKCLKGLRKRVEMSVNSKNISNLSLALNYTYVVRNTFSLMKRHTRIVKSFKVNFKFFLFKLFLTKLKYKKTQRTQLQIKYHFLKKYSDFKNIMKRNQKMLLINKLRFLIANNKSKNKIVRIYCRYVQVFYI